MIYIPIILGTSRKERMSEHVARYVHTELSKIKDIETDIIDPRDHITAETIPAWITDEQTEPWKKIAKRADAFIIIVPEYNHGYPGELKILLDSAYKDEYQQKSVALCGVSSGILGGARGVENLKPVLNALYLNVMTEAVYFGQVKDLFDAEGTITDVSYGGRLAKLFEQLLGRLASHN